MDGWMDVWHHLGWCCPAWSQRNLQQTCWLSEEPAASGQMLPHLEATGVKCAYVSFWKLDQLMKNKIINKMYSQSYTNWWCTVPVAIAVGFFNIQLGMTRPENMENPKMKMFLDEFMSAYWICEKNKTPQLKQPTKYFKGFQWFKDVYLQVRNSCCTNDTKHDHEHASNHRWGDGCKYSTHFTKYPHGNHKHSAGYYHHAAPNLQN